MSVKDRPRGFKTGGRVAGTPNKSTKSLFDMCDELNFSPFESMLKIAKDETHKDSAMMLKEVSKYLYPTRKAVELSGSLDPKMQEAADDVSQLSKEEQVLLLEQQLKDLKNGS